MQASLLIQSINHTGIEQFLGGTPVQLPVQLQAEQALLYGAKSVCARRRSATRMLLRRFWRCLTAAQYRSLPVRQ